MLSLWPQTSLYIIVHASHPNSSMVFAMVSTCFHHASLRFTGKPHGQVKEAKKKRAKDDASVDAVGEIFARVPCRGRIRQNGRTAHFRVSPAKHRKLWKFQEKICD